MEIELKLLASARDLARLQRLPQISAAARGKPHSELLHAVYYDTPEHDLKAQGVALRVRREGGRWIQCIKGPGEAIGGLHRRTELEWPVTGETPDVSLLERSPFGALFRKRRVRQSLGAVFSTEFRRRTVELDLGRGSSAELAVDSGHIRVEGRIAVISEAELELVRGKPQAVLDFAFHLAAALPLRVGHASKAARGYALAAAEPIAPWKAKQLQLEHSMTAAAACLRIFDACTAQIHRNEEGFLGGSSGVPDPEYLHQMRVGLRRLRIALAMPRDRAWRTALGSLREELQWLSRTLSQARDWDVFAEQMLPLLQTTPGEARTGVLLERARNQVLQTARESIRGSRYQQLWLRVAGLCVAHSKCIAPDKSAPAFARRSLSRRYARLTAHGEPGSLTSDALHALRIDAKKLRYTAEFFASLALRKEAARFVAALKGVQDVLGRISDANAGRAIAAELGTSLRLSQDGRRAAAANSGLDALKPVFRHLNNTETAARAELSAAWRRFMATPPHWTAGD